MQRTTENLRRELQQALGTTYTIERELGGGGMSRIYVANENSLDRKVVVKVLPPEVAAGVKVERFKREIQFLARLHHPHIVPLLAAGGDGALSWYVMPFMQGESLRGRLIRRGKLPPAQVVRTLREVSSALSFAHQNGIVHRDIKPDNVLLVGGSAMVTDFGVAKALSAASGDGDPNRITSLGVALGTPSYIAPEQATADPTMDHRADLYSLGAMAYEMLCGRPPFMTRNPQAMLAAHISERPVPLIERQPNVPTQLNTLVMSCLEKHADNRPADANEIMDTLDRIPLSGELTAATLDDLTVVSDDAIDVAKAPPMSTAKHPMRWLVIALIAAATVIAGLLIGRGLARSTSPNDLPSPPGSTTPR
ncbi:MAG TPA: serine/threonine-protein kinase [Gemmatimonadaceae bacterium]|nr:serine/threonine-protein kinase [Gemmatimonadaceae bacterium]